jgi:phage FluMu gp28-like protein
VGREIYAYYGSNAAEELDCIPSMGSGVYLPRALVERCQDKSIPQLTFKQKPEFVLDDQRLRDRPRMDRGRAEAGDRRDAGLRTVSARTSAATATSRAIDVLQQHAPVPLENRFQAGLRRIPFDCQQRILFFILDNVPLFHHAKFDARGNGQSHAEAALQRYGGARVECVMITQQWYAENMPHYKAALEGKTSIMPGGEDVIADHRRA